MTVSTSVVAKAPYLESVVVILAAVIAQEVPSPVTELIGPVTVTSTPVVFQLDDVRGPGVETVQAVIELVKVSDTLLVGSLVSWMLKESELRPVVSVITKLVGATKKSAVSSSVIVTEA